MWQDFYPSAGLWRPSPFSITLFVSLVFLTAGTPSMGPSYILNCSVPGRGISGQLCGWLFPFLYQVSSGWRFFHRPFCFRPPVQKNSFWFSPGRSLLFCSVVQLERGKASRCRPESLALHAFPCCVALYLESCKVSNRAFWVMGRVTVICVFCWGVTALPSFRE